MNRIRQVGEGIAALAVVVSVVFVGVEIRQNSEAQIRSTTQFVVSYYIASLEKISDSGEFACIYVEGAQDWLSLSGSERLRFSARFRDYVDALIRDNPPIEDYLFEDGVDPACA